MNQPLENSFFIFLLILIQLSDISFAQNKINCASLRTGIFHSYPKNTKDHYFTRGDSVQQLETNVANGDSVVWIIHWTDDCDYALQYESGGNSMNAQSL